MLDPAKPDWLRISVPADHAHLSMMDRLKRNALCTVCVEARCPNQLECFKNGTATFMLLGPGCTRRCAFCAVDKQQTAPPNPDEPKVFANAIGQMGLGYCVLTMVTRDDLADGGASHIRKVVAAIRERRPAIRIELLISDLGGDAEAIESVVETAPAVLNHNIETVKRLYPTIRPQARYSRSLSILDKAARHSPAIVTKSGIMLGLGESRDEVMATMIDLRNAGCRILTLGQYLAPSKRHHPVMRYVHPGEFEDYRHEAYRMGFSGVASGPLVRSSYKSEKLYHHAAACG